MLGAHRQAHMKAGFMTHPASPVTEMQVARSSQVTSTILPFVCIAQCNYDVGQSRANSSHT
jgi:hypothetical protein